MHQGDQQTVVGVAGVSAASFLGQGQGEGSLMGWV